MFTEKITPIQRHMPVLPTPQERDRAIAANLRERALTVEQAGEPVIQAFHNPSFRDLQQEERQIQSRVAEHAAGVLFGGTNRMTNRQAIALEGAAMYLVRRVHPEWMQATVEQAVETLLVSEEFVALAKDRSAAEKRVLAHRMVSSMLAAIIGVLENERSVAPAVYLRLAAAAYEQGAR